MPATTTGILLTQIGQTYDLALCPNPLTGSVAMVGYMLAPGSEFVEATDLQDDQHLVQVASPSSSDRFSRYPKISQGEWTGGERQLIFVDPTRYYQSSKLETAIPGHLRIAGQYIRTSFPANLGSPSNVSRGVGTDVGNTGGYAVGMSGGTAGNIAVFRWSGGVFGAITDRLGPASVVNTVQEILTGADRYYGTIISGTTPGLYQRDANPSLIVTNDSPAQNTLAYIGNAIWYAASTLQISKITFPFPGAAPGTAVQTANSLEGLVKAMGSTPSGLVFLMNYNVTVGPTLIYTWDGISLPVLVGTVWNLVPLDVRTVAGITFLLFGALGPAGNVAGKVQPVIYSLTGSQLAVFDDYRYLDIPFQATGVNQANGRLDGDDTFLYLFWPGLSTKRYDLANTSGQSLAICDVGDPARAGLLIHSGVISNEGSFFEYSDNPVSTNFMLWGTVTANNDTGFLITSWYDAATPGITKYWRSFEVELNAPLGTGASVTVTYDLDNQSGFANTLTLNALPNGNLIAFFPTGTKATRIRFRLLLTASNTGVSPDLRSYSVKPSLGRVWHFTVIAEDNVLTHSGEDGQGTKGADLISNVMAIYNNGGKGILFVPDASAANGVAQFNVSLEDYTRRSRAPKPGPTQDEFHNWDQEALLDLSMVEEL